MNKHELNMKASEYAATKDEAVFNEIFIALTKKWRPRYEVIARDIRATPADVEASYADTLWKVLNSYDSFEEFEHLLNNALRNARLNLGKKCTRLGKREMLTVDGEREDGTAILEIADADDLGERKKRKDDQRQLISFLLRNADPETTAIISEFGNYESPNALAKAMGIHHEKVARKLRKLAKNHDASIFGDFRQYLSA